MSHHCCGTGSNDRARFQTIEGVGNVEEAGLPETNDAVRAAVRDHYAAAARAVSSGAVAGCCGSGGRGADLITGGLYSEEETEQIPHDAVAASLGCGNPTALAELYPGETVLDLGSGGGIDVLLSARRVGPAGKAYGLDMTDEMLDLAKRNKREAGVENAEFIRGSIEAIPLPTGSVDVVISNCVINLSPEKERVFSEIFRVLRPGGRVAVSDIVFHAEPHSGIRRTLTSWSSCIGGALTETGYEAMLRDAGFEDIGIEFTREYGPELLADGAGLAETAADWAPLGAAFVRARKPASPGAEGQQAPAAAH